MFWYYEVMTNFVETEYKILDIDLDNISTAMEKIGAKKVYDDIRTITYFDYPDSSLQNADKGIKLTEEDKLKLEYARKSSTDQSDSVKLFVSRKEEAVEFLARLNLFAITAVKARRISYELDGIDFDIDCFPEIPPFMEVDLGDSDITLNDLLDRLNLSSHEPIITTTPEIFARYGKDYFEEFKITNSQS
jgi:adenylate cyclase class 2